jgi:hypothetical protein
MDQPREGSENDAPLATVEAPDRPASTKGRPVSAQLPPPVAEFVDTINAGDTIGFLDSFTPDAIVDDWGRMFCDREAIRAWSDKEFIGAKGRLTATDVATGDSTVEVIADWRSTHANGLSRFVFTVVGDKIARMQISAAQGNGRG